MIMNDSYSCENKMIIRKVRMSNMVFLLAS